VVTVTLIPVIEHRVEFIKSIAQTTSDDFDKVALETALEVIEQLHEWAKAHLEADQARANLPF